MRNGKKISLIPLLLLLLLTATVQTQAKTDGPSSSVKFKFSGSNPAARNVSPSSLPVETHFFEIGYQKTGGQSYTPKCAFTDIYPDIDFVCLGDEYAIEYIFLVHPGGDPSRVLLGFEKAAELNINNTGNITYQFENIEITQSKPVVFERKKNTKVMLDGSYNAIAFESTVGLSPSKVFDEQISNEEFMYFLNDTELHPTSLRAANMVFDEYGNVWISKAKGKDKGRLFQISKSRLAYDDNRPVGERYAYARTVKESRYYKHRPIAGVSWCGAIKFTNWLTLINGYGIGMRQYKEGPAPADWTKPPEDGWGTHFFNVSQSDPKKGFKIQVPYSPTSDIEIHIFLNFYAATPGSDVAKKISEPPTGSGFTDTPEGFVEPEGFVAGTPVVITTASTDNEDTDNNQDKDDNKDKKQRSGVLYKTQPDNGDDQGDDNDDQGDDNDQGGGGGPLPSIDYIVSVDAVNAPAGIFITLSTPDLNGLTDGITPFTRTFDYATNTIITLTAPATEPSLNPFSRWQLNGANYSTNLSITLPVNASMNLRAVYTQLRDLTVLSINPAFGVDITINPTDLNSSDSTITTASDFRRTYANGANVTLTAPLTDPTGNRFLEWRSNLGATYSTRTINVTMNSDLIMTAVYATLYQVTLASQNPPGAPLNVSITVSPNDINNDGNATTGTDPDRTYLDGTAATFTAPDDIGGGTYFFERWRRGAATYFASRTINVTVNAAMTLTAEYLPLRTITILSSNPNSGVIVTTTSDVNSKTTATTGSGDVDRLYRNGTSVTLTAPLTSLTSTTFQRWESGSGATYFTRQITITANTDETYTAYYVAPWTLTVTSQNPNSGVAITVTPDSLSQGDLTTVVGGTDRTYNNNDPVELTADPGPINVTNVFWRWANSLGGYTYNSTVNFLILTNMTMTAEYAQLRRLTVNSTDPGAGVAITISPIDAHQIGNGATFMTRYFPDSQVVTVTTDNVADGQTFLKWQLDGSDYPGTATTTVTMGADHDLVAVYSYIPGPIDDPDPSPGGL